MTIDQQITEDQAHRAIICALTHMRDPDVAMRSSAILCCDDARANFARRDFTAAYRRAVDSLRYSVGILHPDFQQHHNLSVGNRAA